MKVWYIRHESIELAKRSYNKKIVEEKFILQVKISKLGNRTLWKFQVLFMRRSNQNPQISSQSQQKLIKLNKCNVKNG